MRQDVFLTLEVINSLFQFGHGFLCKLSARLGLQSEREK